ncbi:WD40-repeat-containing domain protein [Melanogaster broomeanus]|nr:WD40-repeat-containing domain protein [Melanogaster broomeanus]
MSRYPHTRLFSDPHRSVVLSGPHIHVLNTETGHVLHTTANFADQDKDALIKSGPIRCSAISREGRYLAIAGDDKRLKIWDIESLTLLSARELPKKPTSIEFTKSNDIVVADKFGDVFRYPLHPSAESIIDKKENDLSASHENPSGGELVLGHASLLTSCLLSPDEQFIITADRDEHIRVSWYPQGYTIESYCLGHEKYVSAIHLPISAPASLISGGGDPDLKVWDWMTGRLQRNIAVFAIVEPFIKVKAQKRKRGPQDDENQGDETLKGNAKRKNKGKGKRNTASSLEPEDSSFQQHAEVSTHSSLATETVFVLRRIGSFVFRSETHVVFSAVGATAIFEFILTETDDRPGIRHFDFGKPVIDFMVLSNGSIWALLDADYLGEADAATEREGKLVREIRWSIDQFVEAGSSALLDCLNCTCSLSATTQDLKVLDLYSDLLSLPKSVEAEAESRAREPSEPLPRRLEDSGEGDGASTAGNGKGLTKRAIGRMKHKRALERLAQGQMDGPEVPGPDSKRMKADADDDEDVDDNAKMDLT